MDILSNAKMIDLKPNTNILWENDEGIFLLNWKWLATHGGNLNIKEALAFFHKKHLEKMV